MSRDELFGAASNYDSRYDSIWTANSRNRALYTARRKYSAGINSSSPLNVPQQAHAIGDPVPIAFARRRQGAGGILISPRATECRFQNSVTNAVTAFYHLVLSEGEIGDIQVRDVFQRQCRVGEFQQTYDRRAGSWIPENAIVTRAGYTKPEASNFCGSVGTYDGMSTMSFKVTIPNGIDVWNRQVHAFIRDGIKLYRWADEQANVSSDSFADLAYWLMVNSARIPAALIDTASIQRVSRFLNANGITTNCWITQAVNYGEFVTAWGRYHLVQPVTNKGKVGLKPLLPINEDYTIKTTPLSIDYTFDDDSIIPGSVDIQYSNWASRQPFVCQMVWRQQNEADIGVVRTSEVRYAGTAANGPYESHDLSEFCTRELHAIRVGAYILAKRIRSNHSIRFRAKPGLHSSTLQQGSIVRVRLLRAADNSVESYHDHLYEVDRIGRAIAGEVSYEASYLPVDDQLRSLIALDVMAVTESGVVFSSGLTGEGCDINSSGDTTVPDDDPEDTILPGPDDPAIEGGGDTGIGQGGYPIDQPGSNTLVDDALFDQYIEQLTDQELVDTHGDLLDDLADEIRDLSDAELADLIRDLTDAELADLMRDLSDAELEDLFDGSTAAEIRALTDAELAVLARALTNSELATIARALTDAELVSLLDDFVRGLIKQDLQFEINIDPVLVQQIITTFREAYEKSITDEQTDTLGDHEAGIYFHTATWAANVLTVRMRLAPTGKAPRADLGNLNATIASASVVALLPSGQPASPQPGSLPTVSSSGLIAEPWDAEAEGLPFPPADRVFEGTFAITFAEGDFPPVAGSPSQQLTYRATVEFTDWTGGFTEVSFLNTLTVDFVPTEVPAGNELVLYWSGGELLSTDESVTVEEISNTGDIISGTLTGQDSAIVKDKQFSSSIIPTWSIAGAEVESFLNGGDYTIETYGRVFVDDDTGEDQIGYRVSYVWIFPSKLDYFSEGNEVPLIELLLSTGFSDETGSNHFLYGRHTNEEDETTQSESDPYYNSELVRHFCLQKIGSSLYFHLDGVPNNSYLAINSAIEFERINVSIEAGISWSGDGSIPNGTVKAEVGQIRISDSALYGTGSFTPPATAFYDPTP